MADNLCINVVHESEVVANALFFEDGTASIALSYLSSMCFAYSFMSMLYDNVQAIAVGCLATCKAGMGFSPDDIESVARYLRIQHQGDGGLIHVSKEGKRENYVNAKCTIDFILDSQSFNFNLFETYAMLYQLNAVRLLNGLDAISTDAASARFVSSNVPFDQITKFARLVESSINGDTILINELGRLVYIL